jgi:membrane protein
MTLKKLPAILKQSVSEFSDDNVPRLAAALAYYTVFSLAPLLVIALTISAFVLGEQGLTSQISSQIQGLVGQTAAVAIQTAIESANQPRKWDVAAAGGILALLFGASGVFGELQQGMNIVWDVKPKPGRGIMGMIKDRFFSFAMVLGTGFLLLVSGLLAIAVNEFGQRLNGIAPWLDAVAYLLNLAVSLGIATLLFALIFKILPDAEVRWKYAWLGGFFTAVLFNIGKELLAVYITKGHVGDSYGVAGSLIAVLVWVYYCSMILMFGAEFTQVYHQHASGAPAPTANAERA